MEELDFIEIMDELMIKVYKITQEDLDFLFDIAEDEELRSLVDILTIDEKKSTFSQKRKALEIKHKYLKK